MTFDRSELVRAAPHVAFDIYHFRIYAKLYKELLSPFSPVPQAIVYSLLLHFRVLLDFFYKNPVEDDCWVGHFRVLPGFEAAFPQAIHTPPPGARQVSINLNKRLAHLTATRWREKAPDMAYYSNYFEGIEKLIVAFQAALPNDVRQSFDCELQRFEVLYKESCLTHLPLTSSTTSNIL